MSDLTDFLLARFSEDETVARTAALHCTQIWTGDNPMPSEAMFAERFTPAHVLAECEAKRQILRLLGPESDPSCDRPWWWEDAVEPALRAMAAPYADHPDFNPDWRA